MCSVEAPLPNVNTPKINHTRAKWRKLTKLLPFDLILASLSSFFEIQNMADLLNQLWWSNRLKFTKYTNLCKSHSLTCPSQLIWQIWHILNFEKTLNIREISAKICEKNSYLQEYWPFFLCKDFSQGRSAKTHVMGR